DGTRRSASAPVQAEENRVRHAIERTDHRGQVPRRVPFDSPLADRYLRITLEVDDHEIVARVHQLTQMIIAVAADAPAAERLIDKPTESSQHCVLLRQQLVHEVPNCLGKERAARGQSSEKLMSQVANRLIDRALIKVIEWLGREGRVPRIG